MAKDLPDFAKYFTGHQWVSNFTSIAVTAQGKVCSDAHGLSSKDVASLQTAGSLNIGWIQLVRENMSANIPGVGSGTGLMDTGWADLFHWNPVTGASDLGLDMMTARGAALGSCSVYTFRSPGATYVLPRAGFLNAGAAVNITGPKGSGRLSQKPFGDYEATKALGFIMPPGTAGGVGSSLPFFEPGTFTVDNGAGGSDVDKFRTTVTVPASPTPLNWTNFDAISAAGINRSTDVTFRWTGGDAASEYIVIGGASFLPDLTSKSFVGAAFLCAEKASAGQFTVPSVVLSALPASTPGDPMSGIMTVGRAPLLTDSMKFTVKGLDFGYATYAQFWLEPVTIQ